MPKSTCAVDSCEHVARARGWCRAHYERWRTTGSLGSGAVKIYRANCGIEGCGRKHCARGLCTLHYGRRRMTGDPGPVGIVPRPTPPKCTVERCSRRPSRGDLCYTHYRLQSRVVVKPKQRRSRPACGVEGCERQNYAHSCCRIHYSRLMKYGDTSTVKRPGWVGDSISYKGVHRRLLRTRGKASAHPCTHCPARARHWAYDHTDEIERTSPLGYLYSVDLARYMPLCYLCHKRFDLRWKEASA